MNQTKDMIERAKAKLRAQREAAATKTAELQNFAATPATEEATPKAVVAPTSKETIASLAARAAALRAAKQAAKPAAPSAPAKANSQEIKRQLASVGVQLPKTAIAEKALAEVTGEKDVAPEVSERGQRLEKNEVGRENLNEEQLRAVELALDGGQLLVTGSAGTGKSTTQRVTLAELARSGRLRPLPENWSHKYIPKGGLSIAIVSFITRAVNNIRDLLPAEFKPNACNIHQFLEFQPVEEEVEDVDDDGNIVTRTRKIFRPSRNADNPIVGITTIVVEESSTVDEALWDLLLDALPNKGEGVQFIYLGDICQIPPVFGRSIIERYGPGLLEQNRVVELTKVYRQAIESPIKRLAIDINSGIALTDRKLREEYAKEGELEFINLSGIPPKGKAIPRDTPQRIVRKVSNLYCRLLDEGVFVPFRDVILCPHRVNRNDTVNCENLNRRLANHHGKMRGATVHEVIAGFNKHYLAEGDPIILNKEEYWLVNIRENPAYAGTLTPRPPSDQLDRYGRYEGAESEGFMLNEFAELEADIDAVMTQAMKATVDDDSSSRSASHILTLQSVNSGQVMEVKAVGDINSMDWAYATTIHKSIGSEWDRVYLCLHHSHLSMLNRELLYTAITRAVKYLQVIYDGHDHYKAAPNSSMIAKAALNPKIKGVGLRAKLEYLAKEELKKHEKPADILAKFKTKKAEVTNGDEAEA